METNKFFKLANQRIDFLDEKSPEELDINYESPTNDSDYALIIKTASGDVLKKFPVNNSTNLVFSHVSYEKNKHKLNEEMRKIAESNLAKRLDLYGFEHDYKIEETYGNQYTLTKEEEIIKEAEEEPTEFAYGDKLPIDNINNLQKSASEFLRQARTLPVRDRKNIAFALVKKASEMGVELPTAILEYSSFTPKTLQGMKIAMATRTRSYPEKVRKLADALLQTVKTAEDCIKVAEMVETIDKELGIKTERHEDPSKGFFSIEKRADQIFNEKLNKALENNLLDDYFTPDVIEDLKDFGQNAYNNLDRHSRDLIDKILNKIKTEKKVNQVNQVFDEKLNNANDTLENDSPNAYLSPKTIKDFRRMGKKLYKALPPGGRNTIDKLVYGKK